MSGTRLDPRALRLSAPSLSGGLAVALAALAFGSSATASPNRAASSARTADTKAWCAAVIRINTKLGAMKNKRYLPTAQISPKTWKAIVDAAVANRSKLLAITPKEIKKAQTDQLAWFARVKANHYANTTALGSFTLAEIRQLTNFQRTKCGITFG